VKATGDHRPANDRRRQCLVTGVGAVTAFGCGVPALARALREGTSGVRRTERFEREGVAVRVAAELPAFELEAALAAQGVGLPPSLLERAQRATRRAPLGTRAATLAALEGWRDARLTERAVPPGRLAIVVAGHNLNQGYQLAMWRAFAEEPAYLSPTYALHFMDWDLVGTLSEIFEIRGEGMTVGGASASGNLALIQGRRLVLSGAADACLVIGALADLSPVEVQAFRQLGALGGMVHEDSPARACRPFDRGHDGFVYGQGCGCVILESEASAEARGAVALAHIRGGAIVLDGNRQPDPNPRGQARAMRMAIEEAGVEPAAVQYLNAHGTGSPAGDASELEAIHEAFGPAATSLWINATKAITGHTLWAAGVIEAIATIVQLRDGFLHPSLNLEEPIDPHLRLVGPRGERADIDLAVSNGFGFGGLNTAIVLSKGDAR
jgi:malonyl-ACP decarboxylase